MSQAVTIHHELGDVVVTPNGKVNPTRLKKMIRSTLDEYQDESRVPASVVHQTMKQRHGAHYRSSGYYLRVYRQRSDLTQAQLAEKTGIRQHHLSEMENDKRVLGKANAKKIATILECDYRKLL